MLGFEDDRSAGGVFWRPLGGGGAGFPMWGWDGRGGVGTLGVVSVGGVRRSVCLSSWKIIICGVVIGEQVTDLR